MSSESIGMAAGRSWSPPIVERRWGPLRFRLFDARHPVADLEVAIAIGGALALLGLALLPVDALALLMPECRFHEATGHPCMTCGLTRAVVALSHGDLLTALRMNPLATLAAVLGGAYTPVAWILWLGRLPRPRLGPASRAARWGLVLLIGALVLANWAFLIADGR